MTPPITPKIPVRSKEYDIVVVTNKDRKDIANFLRNFFDKDEPVNRYINLISGETQTYEHSSTKEMENGINLKAIHNGKLIGVCLNDIMKRDDLDKEVEAKDDHEIRDSIFAKIGPLLDKVEKEANVFAKFPESQKGVSVHILSVNDAYRGQGIAKALVNKTRDLAKEIGAGFVSALCTSHFTALAVKKLGFELHYTLNYADYKDENGQVLFKPEPPHTACTVYVQKI